MVSMTVTIDARIAAYVQKKKRRTVTWNQMPKPSKLGSWTAYVFCQLPMMKEQISADCMPNDWYCWMM